MQLHRSTSDPRRRCRVLRCTVAQRRRMVAVWPVAPAVASGRACPCEHHRHPGHRVVTGGVATSRRVRRQRRARVERVADPRLRRRRRDVSRGPAGRDWPARVAGGISMAAGEWVSVSAQNELIERELNVERRELKLNPADETEELAAMYVADGMDPDRARLAAADVMRQPDDALACTPATELGIDPGTARLAGGGRGSSLVCFLFGAPAAGAPVAVRRVRHGADDHVRRDRRRRRRRRRARSSAARRLAPSRAAVLRQVLIVLGACARDLRSRPAHRHQRRRDAASARQRAARARRRHRPASSRAR